MNVTLYDYQQKAVDFALKHPKCGLFLDLGLGKTLISLAVLETVYNFETGHILIIAPKSIAKATWASEIQKWGVKIPYKSLFSAENGKELSKKKRLEAYEEVFKNPVRTIFFINREMLCDLIEHCPKQNNAVVWPFQTIIADELQSFKSPSSKRFIALKSVMPAVNRFIGLTGTPTPNGLEDIWSQIYLMDEGARLGKNITAFRSQYMHPGYRNQQGVVCSWEANPGADEIIYELISDTVISMRNTQLKLPPIVFIDDNVQMLPGEMEAYKYFVKNAVLSFDTNTIATAQNAAVMSGKLQQLASGAVYTVDKDGKSTGAYEIIHKAKLERLDYIRENSDDNILIAYNFKSDADMITKHFAEKKLPCEIFDSGKADKIIERWNAGKIKTLLIQPAAAGFGLNFQYGGHTLVWYTLPFNLENYLQTLGRVYRQGQTDTVYIHRIMTEKTIDYKVLRVLEEKNQELTKLLDAVEYSETQEESLEAFNSALNLVGSLRITNSEMLDAINATVDEIWV